MCIICTRVLSRLQSATKDTSPLPPRLGVVSLHSIVWSATSRRLPCAPRSRTQPRQKTEPVEQQGACSDSKAGGVTRGNWCRVRMPMPSRCPLPHLPKQVKTIYFISLRTTRGDGRSSDHSTGEDATRGARGDATQLGALRGLALEHQTKQALERLRKGHG